jgi:type I restriction enzyme S subunit
MIRDLPDEWKIEELVSVADKIRDGNYGPDYPSQEEFLPNGVPFLTSTVIAGSNQIDFSKIKFISPEKHEQLTKVRLRTGDILFTNRGANVGSVAVVPKELDGGNIGPQLTQLRAKPNRVDSVYLFCYLQSWHFKKELARLDSGSAMNFFGTTTTGKFRVVVPPLPEQHKIAEILSTWDKAISATERLIAALQQRKKGLMQRLLTGQVRFPGFEGEWQNYKVNQVAKLTAGGTPSTHVPQYWGGEIRWMNSGDIHQKRVYEVENRITQSGLSNSSAKLLPINSVLVALAGQGKTRGTVAINKVELSTNQSVAAIIPKEDILYHEYVFYNLDSRYEELRKLSTGDGGRGGLNLGLLGSLRIKAPSIAEQKRIADVLELCDKEIKVHTTKLDALKQQKKGLMQRLLTGQVRVKG